MYNSGWRSKFATYPVEREKKREREHIQWREREREREHVVGGEALK